MKTESGVTLTIKHPSVAELIDKEFAANRGVEAILERFKNSVIVRALHNSNGNISRAAVLLKTHRNNLDRWMKESGIDAHFPDTDEKAS